MRTVRTLASLADRTGPWRAFPVKALLIALGLVVAAVLVFALVDRVAPAPPKATEPARPAAPSDPKVPKASRPLDAAPVPTGSIVAVIAVLGAAFGTLLFVKRAMKGSRHAPGAVKVLKVRDVLMVGPKRAIYLIGLEDRNLVVGLSGDAMTLLSEYSIGVDEAAPAAAPETFEARTAEHALPRHVPATADATAPARVDVEIGDGAPIVRGGDAPPAPAAPRAFPFGAAAPDAARAQKARTERIPHKFRQLLEKAAGAEGGGR